jgi:hypothetical protein
MTKTEEVAVSEKTFFALCDDLGAYHETLEMLEAEELAMIREHPQDDRSAIEGQLEEVREHIERIGSQLAPKTDAAAAVVRRLKAGREFICEERERLRIKEKAMERAERWLRDYLLSTMEQQHMKQIKTPTNTLFVRSSEAVEVTDITKIPATYFNADVKLPLPLWREIVQCLDESGSAIAREAGSLRVNSEVSLSTIKKAIKSGEDVPGADLRFNHSLVLR